MFVDGYREDCIDYIKRNHKIRYKPNQREVKSQPDPYIKADLMFVDGDGEDVGWDETGGHPEGSDLGQTLTVILKCFNVLYEQEVYFYALLLNHIVAICKRV